MSKKRTSLDAVLGEVPAASAPVFPRKEDPQIDRAKISGKRPGIKQQTAYLALPVYEQVRRLAFEENIKMHALLMEGLDRVFKDRGLPSIAELVEKRR